MVLSEITGMEVTLKKELCEIFDGISRKMHFCPTIILPIARATSERLSVWFNHLWYFQLTPTSRWHSSITRSKKLPPSVVKADKMYHRQEVATFGMGGTYF